MTGQEEKALIEFEGGYNCAQTVMSAFADTLQGDGDWAQKIAEGFGKEVGRLRSTCGAATGSFMVLGLLVSEKYSTNTKGKDKIYKLLRRFSNEFTDEYGAIDCKSITNCDLNTEEGRKKALETNVFNKVCKKCVLSSIRIVKELQEEI